MREEVEVAVSEDAQIRRARKLIYRIRKLISLVCDTNASTFGSKIVFRYEDRGPMDYQRPYGRQYRGDIGGVLQTMRKKSQDP